MANKKADFKLDDVKEIKKQSNVKNCWFDEREGLFHCLMKNGSEWTSPTGSAQDKWTRIPMKTTVQDVSIDEVQGNLMAQFACEQEELAKQTAENAVRNHNVGESDYSKHKIQPWDIWIEYKLNPFDADIIKRVLRHKKTDSRKMDYEKIIHICQERIRQIDSGIDPWEDKNV